MYKAIKNILTYLKRTVGYTLELMFFLLVVFSFSIQTGNFQTFTAKKTAVYLSKKLNSKVHIDKVRVNGLHYFKFEGLYIEDQANDTLVYIPELIAGIKDLNIENRIAVLNDVKLKGATIKLQKYKGKDKLNLQYLIDFFSKGNTKKEDNNLKRKKKNKAKK